jgi:hypothetical protein
MVNRKGMYFWLEMLLLVIIMAIVFVSLPRSEDDFLNAKADEDLETFGFDTLRNLDNSGALDAFTNDTNFTRSNFTALSSYIRNSLPTTLDAKIEYFNGTNCFLENGTFAPSCGNFTRNFETVRAEYAMARLINITTLHLYLGGIF